MEDTNKEFTQIIESLEHGLDEILDGDLRNLSDDRLDDENQILVESDDELDNDDIHVNNNSIRNELDTLYNTTAINMIEDQKPNSIVEDVQLHEALFETQTGSTEENLPGYRTPPRPNSSSSSSTNLSAKRPIDFSNAENNTPIPQSPVFTNQFGLGSSGKKSISKTVSFAALSPDDLTPSAPIFTSPYARRSYTNILQTPGSERKTRSFNASQLTGSTSSVEQYEELMQSMITDFLSLIKNTQSKISEVSKKTSVFSPTSSTTGSSSPTPSSPSKAKQPNVDTTWKVEKDGLEQELLKLKDKLDQIQHEKDSQVKKLKEENTQLKDNLQFVQKRMLENQQSIQEKLVIKEKEIENLKLSINTHQEIFGENELDLIYDHVQLLKKQHEILESDAYTELERCRHELSSTMKQIKEAISKSGGELEHVKKLYEKELKSRKQLFNELQELKGNIRVMCRVRPISVNEKFSLTFPSVESIQVNDTTVQNRERLLNFEFDKVFTPVATQEEVFKEIQSLAQSVLDGYNVSIIAYGPTGSGKTYTIDGPENIDDSSQYGLSSRILSELFKLKDAKSTENIFHLEVSIIEIYNEIARDLLVDKEKRLDVQCIKDQIKIPGLSMNAVESLEDVFRLFEKGRKNRVFAETERNEYSSRSHSIFTIHVTSQNNLTKEKQFSKLHLVDLAGSEKFEVSKNQLETININKSLTALGDVLEALIKNQKFIPFRNSLLTQVLSDGFKKHQKVLMIVNVNPSIEYVQETCRSLTFAQRIRKIELGTAKQLESKTATFSATSAPITNAPSPKPKPLERFK